MTNKTEHVEPKPSPQRPRKRGSIILRLFSLVCAIALAAGAYVAWDAWHFLNTPAQSQGRDIVVDIEPGSSLKAIAAHLEAQGVVTDAWRFSLLVRTEKKDQRLQAGRFLVNTGLRPQEVLEQIVSGRAMLFRVTIPEGRTWWEVAALMEEAGMCRADDFTAVIHDPEFLRHWGVPFPTAEGFLFPDTYLLPQPRELDEKAARSVANRMLDTFWRRTEGVWSGGRPSPTVLKEIITLASIVEKETGVPEERNRVAGVYANRLKKGMLLQADPTVIYGRGPDFAGPIRRSHLDDDTNPYNTYRKAGLPPGPICSPGLAAIRAAITPEEHNYYYFVASGTDRSHVFSTTLEQHNRAVQAYRNAIRQQGN